MGERALLVRPVAGGAGQLYYSQWAGSTEQIQAVLGRQRESRELLQRQDWVYRGEESRGGVVESLDYLSVSALYVATPESVTVLLPVWLGIGPGADRSPPVPSWAGALVVVGTPRQVRWLRAGLQWLKTVLGRAIDAAAISTVAAMRLLVLSLLPFRLWIQEDVWALLG